MSAYPIHLDDLGPLEDEPTYERCPRCASTSITCVGLPPGVWHDERVPRALQPPVSMALRELLTRAASPVDDDHVVVRAIEIGSGAAAIGLGSVDLGGLKCT